MKFEASEGATKKVLMTPFGLKRVDAACILKRLRLGIERLREYLAVGLLGHGGSRKKHVEDVLNARRHLCGVVDRFISMTSMSMQYNAQ